MRAEAFEDLLFREADQDGKARALRDVPEDAEVAEQPASADSRFARDKGRPDVCGDGLRDDDEFVEVRLRRLKPLGAAVPSSKRCIPVVDQDGRELRRGTDGPLPPPDGIAVDLRKCQKII